MNRIIIGETENNILDSIINVIKENNSFLITTHYNIDGDAVGSELALYLMLKRMGKEAKIINHDYVPELYRFLPSCEEIVTYRDALDASPDQFDAAIILDCGSEARMGSVFELVQDIPISVNIDHHFENPGFGKINWASDSYSSTGEMLYFIMTGLGSITEQEAECLYTSIITDTGSFIYNICDHTMQVVQKLIETGIDIEGISRTVIFEKPLRWMRLLSLCLSNLQHDKDLRVSWMYADRVMLQATGTKERDTESFVEFLSRIREARAVFFLRESVDNKIKVSLRSKKGFDVQKIAKIFGGGGHMQASGCYIQNTTLEEAREMILEAIRNNS